VKAYLSFEEVVSEMSATVGFLWFQLSTVFGDLLCFVFIVSLLYFFC